MGFSFQNTTLGDLSVGAFLALTVPTALAINASRVHLRLYWYSLRYRHRTIRISAAYLFRIKLDDKYLLVKGTRFPHYQPAGGVFKFSPQGQAFLMSIDAQDDELVAIDDRSRSDLRIRIPARNLLKFYSWFDGRQGREDSPWREFHEELIVTSVLPADTFPYIFHDYHGRVVDPIRFSPQADSLEILMADIYELLPTREQEEALRRTLSSDRQDFSWFTRHAIERRGVMPGVTSNTPIADHAQKIL
ncbi:SMODS-associated NUDIX domain-containing protein [Streptomyces halstedii]|uniref:SMODS-associated NUDIX domain-containing protein n=1 Tax=Streptomyces halstedii TaxID=1944 RepID=UPI0037FC46C0